MEPINYLQQVADPFAQSLQGYKIGAGMADIEAKRAQAEQQQKQAQIAFEEQARFFAKPKPTMRDALQFVASQPKDRADALRPYIENFSKEQQQNVLKANSQILSALQINPPLGIKMLNDYATGQRNSGDEEEALLYERLAEAAADPTKGPAMAFKSLVTVTSRIPGAKEMFETIDKATTTAQGEAEAPAKLRGELAKASEAETKALVAVQTATDDIAKAKAQRQYEEAKAESERIKAKYAEKTTLADFEKKAADLGLTKAQTGSALAQGRKLGAEASAAILELEALKKGGTLATPKAFEQEEKLRKEFQLRTKVYGELGGTFNNIKSSADAKTGPGDIALITGFMKMLDPGSVVRETEFATARDTAGLYTRLENSLKKAETGQFLQPNQRSEFVNLAKQYLDSAQKKAGDEKKALGVVVKNYRLNPENVFGPETEAAPGGQRVVNPPLPTGTPTNRNVTPANSAIVGGQTYTRPANFTDAQWSAYKQSMGVQ